MTFFFFVIVVLCEWVGAVACTQYTNSGSFESLFFSLPVHSLTCITPSKRVYLSGKKRKRAKGDSPFAVSASWERRGEGSTDVFSCNALPPLPKVLDASFSLNMSLVLCGGWLLLLLLLLLFLLFFF